MSITDTLQVRVKTITWEADGILSFELWPMPPRKELPAFTAGAHVDVHLPNGVLRSYSLLNSQDERNRYVIGVNKDAQSRGGSRYMHETLRAGDALTIGFPRNNFPLDEAAPLSVFIAGGIGITPLRSMIRRMQSLGKPWRLHYAARTRQNAAFVDALQALRDETSAEVHFTFDREPGARMLDIPGIVDALPTGAHIYCCGPLPMLDAFEAATKAVPPGQVHVEYFAARESAATEGGFTVELARSRPQRGRRAGSHHPRLSRGDRHRPALLLPRRHLRHLRSACARRYSRSPRPRAQRRREGREQPNDDLLLRRQEQQAGARRVAPRTLSKEIAP